MKGIEVMKKLLILFCLSLLAGVFAEQKAEVENALNVSWGDAIVVGMGNALLDTTERISDSMQYWNDCYNGKIVLWRMSDVYLSRYYNFVKGKGFSVNYQKKCEEIYSRFDPVKHALKAADKNGQKILLYMTFLDHGCPADVLYGDVTPFPWQDRDMITHPEYQEKDITGKYHYGVLDLSNAEARKFMINRLTGLLQEYGGDGIYLCSRTHSPPARHGDQFGFGPEIVKEYQKRYGIDITEDPRFDYRQVEYAPDSEDVKNWRKLRGEYLVKFVAELRKEIGDKLLYIGLPMGNTMQAPYGNMYVDKKAMIENKLIDGMILNVISGRFLYSKRTHKHQDLGYLESSEDNNYNLATLEDEVALLQTYKNGENIKYLYSSSFTEQPRKGYTGTMMISPEANDSVYIRDFDAIRKTANFTIEGFFYWEDSKIARSYGAPRLVCKYGNLSHDARGWEIYLQPNGTVVFRTHFITPDKSKRIDQHTVSSARMIFRKWTHIACTVDYDKMEKRIYVDGKLVGQDKIPAGYIINPTTSAISLGAYDHNGHFARILIDELRYTANADFQGVPTQPYTGQEADTVFLYHFDDNKNFTEHTMVIGEPKISDGKFGKALNLIHRNMP